MCVEEYYIYIYIYAHFNVVFFFRRHFNMVHCYRKKNISIKFNVVCEIYKDLKDKWIMSNSWWMAIVKRS